jgi:integrase/recombinase XerD
MDSKNWLTDPAGAYREWQAHEAAGAGRKPFSPRSIVQHAAMFDRLLRHLIANEVTLATFGADHLASFFADLETRCHAGTSTRPRYITLIERLGRELVETGLRKSNPAAEYGQRQRWPEGEPQPVFLDAGPMPFCRRTCSLARVTARSSDAIAPSWRSCSAQASRLRRSAAHCTNIS